MKSLLLVSHGSRRAASNDEVRALADRLRERAGAEYDRVACAFLELAEPSIPDAIDTLVQAGSREIVVLPHFLAAGAHVAKDIPQIVEGKRREHPDVCLHLAPYLGAAPGIVELLLAMAEAETPSPA